MVFNFYLGMLELFYLFHTWHTEFCYSFQLIQKASNAELITKVHIKNMLILVEILNFV